ncbi:MAG: HAD family hydrolase [Rhodanobacteraceae bacterium]
MLFDFGGVLTTSVLESLRAFGAQYNDPNLIARLFRKGERGGHLLVAVEEGRITRPEYEAGLAKALGALGIVVEARGLVRRMHGRVHRDHDMIALVAELRHCGYRVGLLSNSLGEGSYEGFDLPAMFDAVTISGQIGFRKPSHRAYQIACENLGAVPGETIMVDDLEQNIAAAVRLGLAGVVHRDAASTRAALMALLVPSSNGQAVHANPPPR